MKDMSRRIFISKLPSDVSEADLKAKFSNYGQVTSTEINQRKNSVGENQPRFAYINLDVNDFDLQRCFKDFANKKWKDEFVDVQIAKESFLSRLKKEREAQSADKPDEDRLKEEKNVHTLQPSCDKFNNAQKREFPYEARTSTIVFNETEDTPRKKAKHKIVDEDATNDTAQDTSVNNLPDVEDLVIKNNKFKSLTGHKLKIQSVNNGLHTGTIRKDISKPKLQDPKHVEADQKRLQSMIEMRKEFRQQKSQIQAALSNIDAKRKNKIVFDTDGNAATNNDHEKKRKTKESKKPLFNDSEDEDGSNKVNFEIKQQFQGKKGQKLLQLQSQFKNDKRFAMDAKFLEEDESGKEDNEETSNIDGTAENEKLRQFDILEEVLGVRVAPKFTNKKEDDRKQKVMLRFDPNQPEHSMYEIKQPQAEEKKTKRKRQAEDVSVVRSEETEPPEVSKTKFYKVTDDLKNVFQEEGQSFSLLSSFGQNVESRDDNEEEPSKASPKKKNILHEPDDIFKYYDEEQDGLDNIEDQQKTEEKPGTNYGKFWSDSFFFGDDDYRLQDGLDFIRGLEIENRSDFVKVRRNLKEIVRAKVRNNQRKNKMFKKKLGGHKKRIKMKKAFRK